jgi:uncharacterized protein (DUF2252 family)
VVKEAVMGTQDGQAVKDAVAEALPPSGGTPMHPRRTRAGTVSLSPDERRACGKAARGMTPRSSHAVWPGLDQRRSPIDLLEEQARTRVPDLVPIRYGRMLVSPFSYFRGAALPMAADLAVGPTSGLTVQLCGDAHLSNFGMFGSPERHLFFDVNDFDETGRGPWEWDVKRLAASLEVSGRDDGFSDHDRKDILRSAVRSYRETMREFSDLSMLDVWYAHLDCDDMQTRFAAALDPRKTPSVWRAISRARAHDSHQAYDRLVRIVDGEPRIVSDPPLIVAIEELGPDINSDAGGRWLHGAVRSYARTLQPDRRHLLEQYRFAHLARKVVGVGSVGSDAWIVLLVDHARHSPVFLQIKQAEASVLERFTSKAGFSNHGQRVVQGQRMMQASTDIFLGWVRDMHDGVQRDYYIRQLRDWKGSADIAGMTPAGMQLWGRMCGWTLARAHARTGDRIAIASYLGTSDAFDRAIVKYSHAYADQNQRDYVALQNAVRSGRVIAEMGR